MTSISTYYATIKDSDNVSVPNENGCTNLGCMDINGNTLYCIKVNSAKTKASLYKYTFSGNTWVKSGASIAVDNALYGANGMAYRENPDGSDKAILVACNAAGENIPKFVKMRTSGAIVRSYKTCTGTTYTGKFGAITAYKDQGFIVMANDWNTADQICLMRGKFDKATESFGVLETFYVNNQGYQGMQDIYYDERIGLFIPTCTKDDTTRRNVILQVDYDGLCFKKPSPDSNGKIVYKPVDRIAVIKSKNSYNDYQVESIALDSTKHFSAVGNLVDANGKGVDAIMRMTNITIA